MQRLVPVTQDDVPDVEERLQDHDQLGNDDLLGLKALRPSRGRGGLTLGAFLELHELVAFRCHERSAQSPA